MRKYHKVYKLLVCIAVLLTLCNFSSAVMAKDKNNNGSILSIKNLVMTINSGDTITLPNTISATSKNHKHIQVIVKWDNKKIDSKKTGTILIYGTVKDYFPKVLLTVNIKPAISNIEDLSFNVKLNANFKLPPKVKAILSDGTSDYFNVDWNIPASSSIVGSSTYTGIVEGYKYPIKAIVNVYSVIQSIDDIEFTVNQNSHFSVPDEVTAKMSDNKTKMVKVIWNKDVDVSKCGLYYLVGDVKDYAHPIRLKVTVVPTILSISDINMVIKANETLNLPEIVTALYSDKTEKSVEIKWQDSDVNTSASGKHTISGRVQGYNSPVHLTIDIINEFSNIDDINQTVSLGESYALPKEVKATAVNGTIKNVAITWKDTQVDTSITMSKVFVGIVIGYSRPIKLTLQVKRTSISIPDQEFKKCILSIINKPGPDIYKDEVAHITQLDLSGKKIHDLTGIENFTCLKDLNIGFISGTNPLLCNYITNIQPLANLKDLETLNISGNKISDISSIKDLVHLRDLHAVDNNIVDLTPLKDLKNLYSLYLGGNSISDITPISGLTNLVELTVSFNNISDISCLSYLKNLRYLAINKNHITDIKSLTDMIDLNILYLNGNPISDYTPAKAFYSKLKDKDFDIK